MDKVVYSNLKLNLSKCIFESIRDVRIREEEIKTYFNLDKQEFKVILKLI